MGDDEKINIGRNAENLQHNPDMASKTKAERAASLFPRLRGPVDEFGNAAVAGGAPEATGKEERNLTNEKALEGRVKFQDVPAEDYRAALDKNKMSASLTDASVADLSKYKRYQAVVDGKPTEAYFGLSPDGELVGAANNGPIKGLQKFAMEQRVKDALADGKTPHLNAWDVNGQLPKRYERFGFKSDKFEPYDEAAYGAPSETLKDAWKAAGWKEGDAYPGVRHMSYEQPRNAKGAPIDEFGNPTVSGGSQAAGKKALPAGDDLIKKYGESSGDPKDLTFILKDGRGVANTGVDHDMMLGGKATDKTPPREQFIADGNIRIRPHTGAAGREVSISIPESGINDKQLAYIQKMAPQLKSGAVLIEIGKRGGDWKTIPHGEATPEALGKVLNELAPMKNAKGSPSFDPNRFHTTTTDVMEQPGKKKSPLKKM
jgi:hypothetical protein